MRVVLIHLNGVDNVSSRLMHAVIDKAGFDVHSIFFRELIKADKDPTGKELDVLMGLAAKLKPDIVGIGVNSMRYFHAVEITRLLKERMGTKVIWGGVQTFLDPERCLEHADYICVGEGDQAFTDFLKVFGKGERINTPNIWWKESGKVIKGKEMPLYEDLDTLPIPDFTEKNKYYIIDAKVYRKNPINSTKYFYSIFTSRGCPFKCNYCLNHLIHEKYGMKFLRRRSVDRVIHELKVAKRLFPHLQVIYFTDDVFIMDKKWLGEFQGKYKKDIGIPFECFGHPSFINEDIVKIAKDRRTGC